MVRFPVSVLIMEDGDLSPVENEDSILVDMNSDRLVEARCVPLPNSSLRSSDIPRTSHMSPGRAATMASPLGRKSIELSCMTVL